MAKHEVKLVTHRRIEVGNADFEFEVHEDGAMLGTLKVSRGSVDWRPRNKMVSCYELQWAELDNLMRSQGREKKVPARRRRLCHPAS